ncbi:MAG: isochorismatase family cysteine hydrolase [Patescibacteria group bacterium]
MKEFAGMPPSPSLLPQRRMLAGMRRQRRHWKSCVLERSALLIVDMQEYFLHPDSHAYIPDAAAILPRVRRLLRRFRDHSRPVIFTRFAVAVGEDDPIARWWGESVAEGASESRIISALRPQHGEHTVRKSSYSAFDGTNLEAVLRSRNIRQIVIAGVCTHLCCDMAAREAFVRGFDVFIAADATATFSQDLHGAALLSLSAGVATPVRTARLLPLLPLA